MELPLILFYLAICVGLGVVVGCIVAVIRRLTYTQSLQKMGWNFVSHPAKEILFGLNVPPFGVGLGRIAKDAVTGRTSSGLPFHVFNYRVDNPHSVDRYALLALPRALPELYVCRPEALRPGSSGYEVGRIGDLVVLSPIGDYGVTFMQHCAPAVQNLAQCGFNVDLSVDGNWLVAAHAPKKARLMHGFVEQLGLLAECFNNEKFATYPSPIPPKELSFHNRSTWNYRNQDNHLLHQVSVTWGGLEHRALNCIFSDNDGLPILALQHHWVTQEIDWSHEEKITKSVHHQETVCEIRLPFIFHNLSINGSNVGQQRHFESSDFEAQYRVRCSNAKFASDVIHPRMMEFILSQKPLPFSIQNGVMYIHVSQIYSPDLIFAAANFAHGFFRRVPSYVWKDLGVIPPNFYQDATTNLATVQWQDQEVI